MLVHRACPALALMLQIKAAPIQEAMARLLDLAVLAVLALP